MPDGNQSIFPLKHSVDIYSTAVKAENPLGSFNDEILIYHNIHFFNFTKQLLDVEFGYVFKEVNQQSQVGKAMVR